jgi:hypothetical protein
VRHIPRTLGVLQLASLIAGAALLALSFPLRTGGPVPEVRLVTAMQPTDLDEGAPFYWSITPSLVNGMTDADLYLQLAVSPGPGASRTRLEVRVDSCASPWRGAVAGSRPRCAQGSRNLLTPAPVGRLRPVDVGRVGSIAPHSAAHLLATFTSRGVSRSGPIRLRVSANVTPCAVARSDELWDIRHTHPLEQANTLIGAQQCATRAAPTLPLGLTLLAATLVLHLAARRIRRGA